MKVLIGAGHATRRMRERGITAADVDRAVNHAHTTRPGDRGGTCFIGPGMDGKDLLVWVLPRAHEAEVVTMKSAAWRDS